jgi:hypothetical protein
LNALFILLGAAAAVAPLAYGALAGRGVGSGDNTAVIGTVAGLMLASAFTLLAVFGQLGAISMAVYLSIASTTARNLILVGIGLTTFLALVYSMRSIVHLANDRPSADAGIASRAFLGSDRRSSALL